MPIKGLTDRGLAFPEIGRIRKGAPKTQNAPGADLTYFRFDIDESETELAAQIQNLYGDQPREIDILLPFDDIDEVFDTWRESYVAGGLVHRCNGDRVIYEIDRKTGEVLVTDGLPYKQCDREMDCKPVGRLKVLLQKIPRLAYLTVLTGSIHDILNLSRQLRAIQQINQTLVGVPLVLRRRPTKISTPSGPSGKRARREKWLLSVEANPDWVKQKMLAMQAAAIPSIQGEYSLLEAPSIDEGDDWMLDDDALDPPGAQDTLQETPGDQPDKQYPEAPKNDPGAARRVADDITTQYWHTARNLGVDHDIARNILDECNQDFDLALAKLNAQYDAPF